MQNFTTKSDLTQKLISGNQKNVWRICKKENRSCKQNWLHFLEEVILLKNIVVEINQFTYQSMIQSKRSATDITVSHGGRTTPNAFVKISDLQVKASLINDVTDL